MGVGGLLLLTTVLVFGVRSCTASQKETALKEYVTAATELVQLSNSQSTALFKDVFGAQGGTDQAVDIQNVLNSRAGEARGVVDQAQRLDPPDELGPAHRYLIEVLELRRDAMLGISDQMKVALGDADRREGTSGIQGWMQVLLASDVLYYYRFYTTAKSALDAEEIADVPPRKSEFVPDIKWLDPDFVSGEVNALRTGVAASGDGNAAPGLHGNGIAAATLGGVALAAGTPATVQLGADVSFEIQVQNQGENTETDVKVTVTVGAGRNAIERDDTIDTIAPGETLPVSIPLDEQPPSGESVPVTVEVVPVTGEGKIDNNTLETTVIFTR